MAYIREMFSSLQGGSHEKYQLLFKISAVFSYLFFIFGLSQMTLIVQIIGNFLPNWQFRLDSKSLELLFSGVMIWILVKTGHGYLFRIPRKNGFGIRF